jgi:F0F1-type ATP synthase epsilon subunit
VLATDAVMAEDIDVDATRRRLDEWEGKLEGEHDALAKAEIAKAMARISIVG